MSTSPFPNLPELSWKKAILNGRHLWQKGKQCQDVAPRTAKDNNHVISTVFKYYTTTDKGTIYFEPRCSFNTRTANSNALISVSISESPPSTTENPLSENEFPRDVTCISVPP